MKHISKIINEILKSKKHKWKRIHLEQSGFEYMYVLIPLSDCYGCDGWQTLSCLSYNKIKTEMYAHRDLSEFPIGFN